MFLPPLTPTVEAALRDIRSGNPVYRIAAAKRLGDAPLEHLDAAVGALLELRADEKAQVRGEALEALANLERSHPGCVPNLPQHLLAAIDDPAPGLREAAARLLAALAPGVSPDAVIRCLGSPHPEVRFHAAGAVVNVPEEETPPLLLRALSDPDPRVKENAVASFRVLLRRMQTRPHPMEEAWTTLATTSLPACLEESDVSLRFEAACALAEAPNDGPLQEGIVAQLTEALSRPTQAYDAALMLADLALASRLGHDAPLAKGALERAARGFFVAPPLRLACAAARVMLGDLAGLTVLRRALRSRRPLTRSLAVELAGRYQIRPLRGDVAELRERPKGIALELLDEALSRIPERVSTTPNRPPSP